MIIEALTAGGLWQARTQRLRRLRDTKWIELGAQETFEALLMMMPGLLKHAVFPDLVDYESPSRLNRGFKDYYLFFTFVIS